MFIELRSVKRFFNYPLSSKICLVQYLFYNAHKVPFSEIYYSLNFEIDILIKKNIYEDISKFYANLMLNIYLAKIVHTINAL